MCYAWREQQGVTGAPPGRGEAECAQEQPSRPARRGADDRGQPGRPADRARRPSWRSGCWRSGLRPYGIYVLSLWAVFSIAAIGLNLTLGYAGQISLAQASFVGIGAYVTALLQPLGVPFAATVVLAAALCFVVGWLLGYPAAAGAEPLPRLHHADLHHARLPAAAQRGLADRRQCRHLRHRPPGAAHRGDRLSLALPGRAGGGAVRQLVAAPLALGPRLHGAAREPGARDEPGRRRADLYAGGRSRSARRWAGSPGRSMPGWCNISSRRRSGSNCRSTCC